MAAGKKIAGSYWDLDDVIAFIQKQGATVELDNEGQVVLYTGLFSRKNGLWTD